MPRGFTKSAGDAARGSPATNRVPCAAPRPARGLHGGKAPIEYEPATLVLGQPDARTRAAMVVWRRRMLEAVRLIRLAT